MEHRPDPDRRKRHEASFAALIQLDDRGLIAHVRSAPKEDLPAEVLARMYRELWLAERFDAADAVVSRLFAARHQDLPSGVGDPEYLRFLLVAAEKLVSPKAVWRDAEDLYVAALQRIVRALRGDQGAQAHTAWKSFCYDRVADARRERTRKDPPLTGLETTDPVSGEPVSRVGSAQSPWQGSVTPDREEELTSFLRTRLEAGAADPRVVEIGLDQFFGDPSPIDVAEPERPDRMPLTQRFALSRFQVWRLRKKAQVVLRRAGEEWTEQHPHP